MQILFKCPTPAIVFGNAAKPSRFAHFLSRVHNPLRLPRGMTSNRPKVVRTPGVFNILTSKCASPHNGVVRTWCVLYIFTWKCLCFAPQRRALFRHRNFQSGLNLVCFVPFDLEMWLRATTACTFSTSQLPKVVRTWCGFVHFDFEMCFAPQPRALFRHRNFQKWSKKWCVLFIFTSKCASRHNGVHFFDITTSKSGPNLVCFVPFDLEMCVAPQRRALVHLSSGQMAPHPPL